MIAVIVAFKINDNRCLLQQHQVTWKYFGHCVVAQLAGPSIGFFDHIMPVSVHGCQSLWFPARTTCSIALNTSPSALSAYDLTDPGAVSPHLCMTIFSFKDQGVVQC